LIVTGTTWATFSVLAPLHYIILKIPSVDFSTSSLAANLLIVILGLAIFGIPSAFLARRLRFLQNYYAMAAIGAATGAVFMALHNWWWYGDDALHASISVMYWIAAAGVSGAVAGLTWSSLVRRTAQ